MRKQCSWCRADMGDVDSYTDDDKLVTHGICQDCLNHLSKNKKGRPIDAFIDELPLPVVLVDSQRRIEFSNEKACQILGKELSELKGRLGGEAFECSYARLPGGCGKQNHCTGCAIRIAVTECHRTGKSQEQVTATLRRKTDEGDVDTRFIISTTKVNDLVLLQIDDFSLLR